jgi:hypothetical protein
MDALLYVFILASGRNVPSFCAGKELDDGEGLRFPLEVEEAETRE